MPYLPYNYNYPSQTCGINYGFRRLTIPVKHNTPDFFERKAKGEFIYPGPYHIKREHLLDPLFTVKVTLTYGRIRTRSRSIRCNYGGALLHEPYFGPPVVEDVGTKLLTKLNGEELNLAMAWLERKDAVTMLAARTALLLRAAKDVKRGKFSRAARTLGLTLSHRSKKRMKQRLDNSSEENLLDDFSANWLEYRYGWTPLLNDIYAASEIIANGFNHKNGTIALHTSTKGVRVFKQMWVGSTASNPTYSPPWPADPESQYEITDRIKIWYKIHDYDLRMKQALGLDNPALILWESVPFSFIGDWFIPIGDSLRAMTAFKGLTFVAGYRSRRAKAILKPQQTQFISYTHPTYPQWTGDDCGFEYELDEFKRDVLTSFDDITLDPWQTKNGLTLVRALDALTLFQRLFNKK